MYRLLFTEEVSLEDFVSVVLDIVQRLKVSWEEVSIELKRVDTRKMTNLAEMDELFKALMIRYYSF